MRPPDRHHRLTAGLTLLELVIALSLSSLLILGLVQITSAASAAGSLQRNQSLLQERARFAAGLLGRALWQAGFNPEPWNDEYSIVPLSPATADDVSARGDRLAVRAWSDRNCFDNRNPDEGPDGRPLFYLRESVFDLTADGHLAHLCRYGPSESEWVTQVRRQGLVPGIEAFQVLYGEDRDHDGLAERWVPAGQWDNPGQVLGVQVGLLVAGDDPVIEPATREFEVLDRQFAAAADGRPRQVIRIAAAIRGQLP